MENYNEILEATPYFYNKIPDQKTWIAILNSLCSIGEDGRQPFLNISLNQANYNDTEESLNKKFDSKLSKYNGSTSINTFFYYAKEYGYKKQGTFQAVKQVKTITPTKATPNPEHAAKIQLKHRFLNHLINLLQEPPSNDNYLFFDRALQPETIKRNKIKSLDQTLNIYTSNPEFIKLPMTEDGKAILDLGKDKRLFRPLLIDLMKEVKPEATEPEIKDFLELIGIFRKVENHRLFSYHNYNYIIPTFDQSGNINNIQFTGNRETRARLLELGYKTKYMFPKSLTGENFPLFYYPLEFANFKDNLVITEGLFDCFSALEYGLNSIALFTANFSLDYQKEKELDSLKHFNIYLLIEQDTAGTDAQNKLKNYMNANGFKLKIKSINDFAKLKGISEPVKDFNDLNKLIREAKR